VRARLRVDQTTKRALVQQARTLRRLATPAERLLWRHVRGNQLGVRVRRQQPVGPFIVDFFVPAVRVVIEIDGSVHDPAHERVRDAERQRQLEAVGFRVLRFRNDEVLADPNGVLARLKEALTPVPPLPEAGEGD
jgi:very-short-patch-repair endonuclease